MVRALQIDAFGDPPNAVSLISRPMLAPGPHQVLVELEAAAINNSDLRLIAGTYGVRPQLPALVGAEGAGRVLQVGDGVEPELAGRRVAVIPARDHGTWATHAVIARRNVVDVDEAADPLQLAMIGINPVTARQLLRADPAVARGDWIAQTGANAAVGQYVIRLARRAGLHTFNVVRREAAADVVRAAGGDVVIVVGDEDDPGELAESEEFALVLDSVGGPVVGALAHRLRFGGRVVSYGAISGRPTALDVRRDVVYRQISHEGFWMVNWLRQAEPEEIQTAYREIAGLVNEGMLTARVQRTYRLEEFRAALSHAARGQRDGKILFAFADPSTTEEPSS